MLQGMLSYASGISDVPLLGETIGANLERTVARFGEREALVDVAAERHWTYSEFDAAVNEVALGLLARGISKGDRVGIWAPNGLSRSARRRRSARSWSTSTRRIGSTSLRTSSSSRACACSSAPSASRPATTAA
jgi:acyl-CoA synthetase (AMP-forming)/AMP-acid ligase II